jgi:hypothetical protein
MPQPGQISALHLIEVERANSENLSHPKKPGHWLTRQDATRTAILFSQPRMLLDG